MEIGAALSSLSAAIGLVKTGVEARDLSKAAQAVGEVSERLAQAQIAGLQIADKLIAVAAERDELRAKLREAEERLQKRSDYVLSEIRPGAYALAFKRLDGDPTPPHYLCQVCFDNGHHSVLNLSSNGNVYTCQRDRGHNIIRSDEPSPQVIRSHNPFSRDRL